MFKKHVQPHSTHVLSGKDVKTLRRDVLKAFPSITEEQLSEVLPAKANVTQTKLLNSRCVVYGIENGNPLFFDLEGRNQLLPTVYTLWVLPGMLPTLPTWSEVSPKILGGADLFLQGVLAPEGGLGDWLAGSVRTVTIPCNHIPFAVGRMAVSKAEAARDGMKGRGLQLLHHYPDLLWAMGDQSVPNEGFTPQRIFPLAQPASGAAGVQAAAAAVGADAAGNGAAKAAEQLGGLGLSEGNSAASVGEGAGTAASGGADAAAAPAAAGEGEAGGAQPSMDQLLEAAVIAGLRQVTNAELPMQTGDFYTKKMLPCKPEGVTFDFKQSSYKKLGKLLDKFEKDKVITQKVIRKQDNISAINRSHPLLAAAAAEEAAAPAPSSKAAQGGSGAAAGAGSSGAAAVKITYCYRAPSSLRPVFGDAGRDKDRLYSGAEVEAALRQYASAAGLLAAGSEGVQLDSLLHGALYNKKEPQKTGNTVPLKDVLARMIDKLQLYHHLAREGGAEVVRKGQVKPVSIADEKRSGRDVTKVAHLESFALSADEMAGVFQRKFQCSATVSKLPGKQEADMEVMLQGRLARQVAEFLGSTYGIPLAFMEVKAGGKK